MIRRGRWATRWCGAGCVRGFAVLFLGASIALAAAAAHGQMTEAERALERAVKAAFIYRFTDFVTWPDAAFAGPDAPFTISVVARDGMAEELKQAVADRTVAGRPVLVRPVRNGEALPLSQIVFIADTDRARLGYLIRSAPRHALLVTETDGALAIGSVINFVIADGRVRFEVSLPSAERRGLKFSSRLLAVALAVRNGGR